MSTLSRQDEMFATFWDFLTYLDKYVAVVNLLDPVETDPAVPPVKALKDVVGAGAHVTSVPYATEMVMLKPSNPVVMVCGPGDPQGCHIVDEKIELAQVVKAVEIYSEFCSRAAKD